MTELVHRHGTWSSIDQAQAAWRHLSFFVVDAAFEGSTGDEEIALVPLRGSCEVNAEGETWVIGGRNSPFSGITSALYLPRDTTYAVRGESPFELAVSGARCNRRRDPVFISAKSVELEIRGAGNATRQINHIIKPEFPAERLLIVEVLTPAGNWSSSPPHKHDEDVPPEEVVLEEIYYYRLSRPEGFALQRLYSPEHDYDQTVAVRDGDLMLVPWGYHTVAAEPGSDLYYLNALAGDRRSMAAADDPVFAWQRRAWDTMQRDPRVPLTDAAG